MKNQFEELIRSVTQYDSLYENVRIVNPKTKEVLFYKEDEWKTEVEPCYALWGNNAVCVNCTSMHAIDTGKTSVKIQYAPGKIYMVTSIPTSIDNQDVVVELLKDATDSMSILDNRIEHLRQIILQSNELTVRDFLTSLYNRRFLEQRLPYQIIYSLKQAKRTYVVMIDIDDFKLVNDKYGHLTGDQVIKSIGKTLSESVNKNEFAARFGGEEFILCISSDDDQTCFERLENIRKQIWNQKHQNEIAEPFRVSCSFGYTAISQNDTKESVLARADAKMYQAKQSGKNCIR